MKFALTLLVSFFTSVIVMAQSGTHSVKRYAKFHQDSKYIITEYAYQDGHLENYITSFPASNSSKLKVTQLLSDINENIEWDEDDALEGNQMTLKNELAITTAFNNALKNIESRLELKEGSIGRVRLDNDFLTLADDQQSFVLINEVIKALSKYEKYADLLPMEGISEEISRNAKQLASEVKGETASEKIGYRNIEYKEHQLNHGIFATNGKQDIKHTNIRAIYNWIFADAYTGWYNRELILNKDRIDDYATNGVEGYMGLGVNFDIDLNHIVDNPTLRIINSVAFQLLDPLKGSKYAYELKLVKPSLTSELAADE